MVKLIKAEEQRRVVEIHSMLAGAFWKLIFLLAWSPRQGRG